MKKLYAINSVYNKDFSAVADQVSRLLAAGGAA
jgi:hypothetical protein